MPDDQVSTEEIAPVEETDWLTDTEELRPRPRRSLLAPIPLALLGVLLIACGFIGGVLVEKGQTSPRVGASGSLTARFAALRGSTGATGTAGGPRTGSSLGGGGLAGRFGGSTAGSATIGQVAYIEGKTLYVENTEGNTVKVRTSSASTITKTVSSNLKGIHPGETVVVGGVPNSHGTVTASSISVGGAGGVGRGLGGLFSGSGVTGAGGGRAGNSVSGSSEGPALFGK